MLASAATKKCPYCQTYCRDCKNVWHYRL